MRADRVAGYAARGAALPDTDVRQLVPTETLNFGAQEPVHIDNEAFAVATDDPASG